MLQHKPRIQRTRLSFFFLVLFLFTTGYVCMNVFIYLCILDSNGSKSSTSSNSSNTNSKPKQRVGNNHFIAAYIFVFIMWKVFLLSCRLAGAALITFFCVIPASEPITNMQMKYANELLSSFLRPTH